MGYCQCPGSILVCSGAVVGRDEARACSKTHDARLNMLSIGATRLRVQSESVYKNRTPECNPARLPQKPPETPLPGPHHLPFGPHTGDTGARAVRSARRAVRLAHPEIRQGKTWRLVFGSTLPRGTRRRAAHDTRCPGNALHPRRSPPAKKPTGGGRTSRHGAPHHPGSSRRALAHAGRGPRLPASHTANNCT